jgi:hypothetical protein
MKITIRMRIEDIGAVRVDFGEEVYEITGTKPFIEKIAKMLRKIYLKLGGK